jgi:hypothetical protein
MSACCLKIETNASQILIAGGNTMKSTKLLLSVGALTAGMIFSGGTRAEDWKPVGQAGFFGVGKAYQIEKGHFYWVGEFSGTFFSDKGKGGLMDNAGVKCPAFSDTDTNTKKGKAGGVCIISDSNGDQAYAKWQNEGDGTTGPGTFEWTGGTGKYQGISGSNTFVGHTEVNWPDGTASGYATWNR